MKRSAPLKRKPRRRRSVDEQAGSRTWKNRTGVRCLVCPAEGKVCDGPIQGHHVISQQALKKRGWHLFLWDLRNKLDVCERRHRQHTDGVAAIPLALVPVDALGFARDLDLEWWVERFYA